VKFLKNYLENNKSIFFNSLLLLLLFIFSKEWIVINEEFIIGLSFLILFYLLQKFTSNLIVLELDNINEYILEQFISLYNFKIKIQKKILKLYKKKINFYKYLKRFTYRIEDQLEIISLRRSLIIKENYSNYTKFLLISFIIKYNYKLRFIYNNILFNINKELVN
jgi:Mitochondrial ATP synthase B chain precursor (ATP-synt_B)